MSQDLAAPPGREAAPPRKARSTVHPARLTLGILAGAVLLVVAVALSIAVGSKALPLTVVWESLHHPQGGADATIVWGVRIPRTIAGLAVGAALGVAGSLIQALTRNPLADPGILGVSAGASVAVALGIGVFGVTAITGQIWFAFAGALAATVLVFVIGSAGSGAADPARLTLAGAAVAAVLMGVTTGAMLLDPVTFNNMRSWNAGTLVERGADIVLPVLPFLAAGLLLAAGCVRALNAMALGDELAAALGARVGITRAAVVIAITLLAGGATAIAGPIVFLGLMVPHIARWIVGPDQRWILAYSLLLSPSILLISDVLGRVLLFPGEVPVGIVMSFVGAPVLILLVRRGAASAL